MEEVPGMYKHQENFIPLSLAGKILFPVREGEHHISSNSLWKMGLSVIWYQEKSR